MICIVVIENNCLATLETYMEKEKERAKKRFIDLIDERYKKMPYSLDSSIENKRWDEIIRSGKCTIEHTVFYYKHI